MTTIVGVKTPNHVVIGSDTLLTQGDTLLPERYILSHKIYRVGDSCVGLSGTVSHYTALIQALREMDSECDLFGYEAIFKTFIKVHKKLKDEFFLNPKKQSDDPYEGNHISAMVANGSGIFGVYAHREVMEFDKFWANGSGRGYALGAMYNAWGPDANEKTPDAMKVAKCGLNAGIEFDRASGGTQRLFRFKAGVAGPPQEFT